MITIWSVKYKDCTFLFETEKDAVTTCENINKWAASLATVAHNRATVAELGLHSKSMRATDFGTNVLQP